MIMMTDDWNDNDNNDDHDDDNDDDDHLIDGDDYPARQTPPARLHGKSRVPTASKAESEKASSLHETKGIRSDRRTIA